MTKTLRDIWNTGEASLGGWVESGSPNITEVIGYLGFDWVGVDGQHGLGSYMDMLHSLQALDVTGTPAFVRVGRNDALDICRALDAGAQGIVVPVVNTAEEAAAVVDAAKFAPEGSRSFGGGRDALSGFRTTPTETNDKIVVCVMIETRQAIGNVEAIAAVPGIDALMIGPYDLAVSMAIDPATRGDNLEHVKALKDVVAACKSNKIAAGIYCDSKEAALRHRAEGFRMLMMPSDLEMLVDAGQKLLAAMR